MAEFRTEDYFERAWWIVDMPHGTVAFVPATTPDDVYELLENTCYKGAPVREWPIRGSLFTSRHRLVDRLLARATQLESADETKGKTT